MSEPVRLPKPTLERFPRYLRVLRKRAEEGEKYISSANLGSELGVQEFQVRKDLTHVDTNGRPGKGYDIEELVNDIEELLGLNNVREAVVVGAGRLGQALTEYPGFARYGLKIVALFDNDPEKVGQEVSGVPIVEHDKMVDLVRRMAISQAIITVPAEDAQEVADKLVAGGVMGIWNFAPEVLEVPPGVYVRNEDLAVGLAALSHHVANSPGKQKQL